jgi:4'-phosphopantetheinyl transferase
VPPPDDLRWALARADEVPAGDDWLGPRERALLLGLRSAPRRADFRLGRLAARRLLGAVEVLPEPSGAPRAWSDGRRLTLAVSLSHRAGLAVCACTAAAELGVDLELVEPRSPGFLRDFLTAAEQAAVAAAPDPALIANLVWSAKEAALKALGVGLTRDTRELEVTVGAAGDPWGDLAVVDLASGHRLEGWWRRVGEHVLTFVVAGGPPDGRRAAES